ncbi:MAG TPA: FtsL-like putative cell division protein [Bacteroidales bacterium]|nr:FtsL-like putative cell division protein [Bacteroidales bacterium]
MTGKEKENTVTENIGEKAAEAHKQPVKQPFLKELLSGSMVSEKLILQNLGYISLITFLAAVYIANRFHAERITRESSRLQREVRDLRSESLSTSADLMYVSRQSQVYSLIREKGMNLEELKTPPFKLIVDK